MTPLTVFVLLFVCYCDSLSIATVRAKKVTKDADKDATGNFYPDWVPFKNKHGDELGEFKPVPKAKPKKRLALPVNFVMRAVAEPGDDYFDKGQGDSDNEDYYEKKDWSDLNRNAKQVDPDKVVNITSVDTSDIEGIVNIITKPETNPIIDLIQGKNETENVSPPEIEVKEKEPEIQEEKQKVEEEKEQTEDSDKIKTNENVKEEKQENESVEEDDEDDSKSHKSKEESKPKENNDSEEETDEEDEEPHKQKSQQEEQEQKENEEKKAKILSSVDELKERHAEEQRAINERVKEEEEHEREKGRNSKEFQDIYNERPSKWKKSSEYDEYDEDISSVEDKYKIISEKSTTTTQKPTTKKKSKGITGKLSVFKNPQLYVAYEDDSDEVTTSEPKTPKSEKFSSRYSATEPEDEENVRISLVPEDNDSKDGEPTLFYPKKKKKNKTKSTTEPTDSFVAESAAEDQKTHSTLVGTIATVIAPSGVDITSSASNTAPSGPDAAPSASDAKSATDSQHASTDKKEEKKNEDFDFERGGGRQHHSEHEEEHEEHGKKAYEGIHKESRKAKGHHEKEDHLGKYADHGGVDKQHHDESGHYGAHHHEEHGKKHAKYEESGKHSKGHSTKGSHDVHKKEEYEKRVEFFEEEGDSAEEEHHGGHHDEKEHKSGGHFKKGKLDSKHEGHDKGDSGHYEKGTDHHKVKGHKVSDGHDSHGRHHHTHHNKEAKEGGSKWLYHHGHPAKTANLVVIDRRADKYSHGPQFYG
ncbi:uncharacterized protein [Epargyreus clarus]|uniref:uncharacterized protein isoform X3 n=1 Tax=Epargyreus clarus TaxID=520877 RepID=UPI003C2EFAC4